jgi:hypothetical protein
LTNKTLTGAVLNGTLGVTTPSTVAATSITASTTLNVTGVATFSAGTAALPAITTTGDTNTGIFFPAADTIAFSEGGTESMRISSSGKVLVGTTEADNPTDGIVLYFAAQNSQIIIGHATGTPSGYTYTKFSYNASTIGSITQNGTTGVLYNLTSDYRLKNNPVALTGAKDFVMALQPKKWQWWDGSGEGVGFIAHEFMEVAKYSGNGTKDAVETIEIKDEQGNVTGTEQRPIMQSIQPSSSEVMANLVAFIQEQQATITALTARITALENA